MSLGRPRLHLRETGSTNARARELAIAGAPHGTLVTAGVQTAGRGRQGRTWTAPAGRALLLVAGPARPRPAALRCAPASRWPTSPAAARGVKWPNDVLLDGRKVAGVLVEGRPQEGWAVLGIGVNAALDPAELPAELRDRAGTLGRGPRSSRPPSARCWTRSRRRWRSRRPAVLDALRARDALRGPRGPLGRRQRDRRRDHGRRRAAGAICRGRGRTELAAGEVHLAA